MIEKDDFVKAPNLIEIKLEDQFYAVINPFQRDGLRLINRIQYQMLNLCAGGTNYTELANQTNTNIEQVKRFVESLNKSGILINSSTSILPDFDDAITNLNLWVHTTDSCNLRCRYCYVHTKDSAKYMSVPQISVLLNKIVETVKLNQLESVTLRLAGGEPLIRFEVWKSKILELKDRLQKLDCDLNVSFLTNLTLLTDEMIAFIKTESIGVSVSLDGLKEDHDFSRPLHSGLGSFDLTYANIVRLIDHGVRPYIMTVVSNGNLEGLVDFTKFLVEFNLPFKFSLVQSEDFDYPKAFKVFDRIYSYLEGEIEKGYSFERKHSLCNLKFNEIYFQTCGAGLNTGTIYTDGNIYFCQQQVGSAEFIGSIHSNEDLLDIIKKGHRFYGELSQDCIDCNYRYICTGDCPLVRSNGKSLSCEFYKKYIPAVYTLIARERLLKIKKNSEHNER